MVFKVFQEFFSDGLYALKSRNLGASAQHTDLGVTVTVQRIEQKSFPLNLCTSIQNGQQQCQDFLLAYDVLRGGLVREQALGGSYVLVKFPIIPMPLLFVI